MNDLDFEKLAITEVLANSNQVVGIVDPDMVVRWLSKSADAYQIEAVGRSITELIHADDLERAAQAFDGVAQSDGFSPSAMAHAIVPIRIVTATGVVPFDTSGRWVNDEQGNGWLIAILQDVTTRFATDQAVRKLAAGVGELESMQAVITACEQFGGVTGAQMIWESGRATRTFGGLGDNPEAIAGLWGDLADLAQPGRAVERLGNDWSYALPVIAGADRLGTVVVWGSGRPADLALVSAAMAPLLDLAALSLKRSREVAELELRATTDQVTGLMNRHAFFSCLDSIVQNAAVMYIDLDAFKGVNDQFGHTLGDRLLNVIGRRLRDAVQLDDEIARIGGDEFGVLCRSVTAAGARSTGDRILDALNQTFVIDGHRLETGASIGIAYTEHSTIGHELLDSADRALLEAKAQGKGRAVLVSSLS